MLFCQKKGFDVEYFMNTFNAEAIKMITSVITRSIEYEFSFFAFSHSGLHFSHLMNAPQTLQRPEERQYVACCLVAIYNFSRGDWAKMRTYWKYCRDGGSGALSKIIQDGVFLTLASFTGLFHSC